MIDIVVGGQFGSEGKGKVAYWLANKSTHKCVVRVGGSNSGHTVNNIILRHLPCTSLIKDGISVIGAGSYLNLDILFEEIDKFKPSYLYIDEKASIITSRESLLLRDLIGSTLSGTGHSICERVNRTTATLAKDVGELRPYLCDTYQIHSIISRGAILEGTQGFGLSLLHSPYYPYCTGRDTTASGFMSELGVSPNKVNDIYLVIRSYPIRVAGNSGPLTNEISWGDLGLEEEFTSVTNRIRRVGLFDAEIVKLAIKVNNPDYIVMNHLDYVDANDRSKFINYIEEKIKRRIDYIGTDKLSVEVNN